MLWLIRAGSDFYDELEHSRCRLFGNVISHGSLETVAAFYSRYSDCLFDKQPVAGLMDSPKCYKPQRLIFLSLCVFETPKEIRKNILFGMLERKQRRAIELAFKVSKGVNLNEWRDDEENTPLLVIAGVRGLTHRITEFLLSHGADINAMNNKGETAMDRATRIRNKNLLAVLNEYSQASDRPL